jgi:hypothetical protein
MDTLNTDCLKCILSYVQHHTARATCKKWSKLISKKVKITYTTTIQQLEWCVNNGYKMNVITSRLLVLNGHLEVLKYARANECEWNGDTCTNAAENGHLEVLKYARANGCDWNSWTCAYAARNGHLVVMKV